MGLHQINVGHDPEQDRLLVRISTTDKLEYRFWLTRHLLKGLWGGLVQRMHHTEPVRQHAEPGTKAAVLGFQHEKAVGESRFDEKYARDELKPGLPGETLLVAAIDLGADESGGHVVVFRPRSGAGVTVKFNDRMLHAFAKLLHDAARRAGWGLPLALPVGAAPEARTVN